MAGTQNISLKGEFQSLGTKERCKNSNTQALKNTFFMQSISNTEPTKFSGQHICFHTDVRAYLSQEAYESAFLY